MENGFAVCANGLKIIDEKQIYFPFVYILPKCKMMSESYKESIHPPNTVQTEIQMIYNHSSIFFYNYILYISA